MYYELGHSILSQNQSTCPNKYYELGYFGLIMDETCQHECEKLIDCVKENKTNFGRNSFIHSTNLRKMYCIIEVYTNHVNHCQLNIEHDNTH